MAELHGGFTQPDPIGIALFIKLHDVFDINHEEFNVSYITLTTPMEFSYTTDIGIKISISYEPNHAEYRHRYDDAFILLSVLDNVMVSITMPRVPSGEGIVSDGAIAMAPNISPEELEEWREFAMNEYLTARAHRDAIFANPAFAPITDLFSDSDRVRMHAEQQLADNVRSNIIFFD